MHNIMGLTRPGASCLDYWDRKGLAFDWVAPIRDSAIRDVERMGA